MGSLSVFSKKIGHFPYFCCSRHETSATKGNELGQKIAMGSPNNLWGTKVRYQMLFVCGLDDPLPVGGEGNSVNELKQNKHICITRYQIYYTAYRATVHPTYTMYAVSTCQLHEYRNTEILGHGYRPNWATKAPRFIQIAVRSKVLFVCPKHIVGAKKCLTLNIWVF